MRGHRWEARRRRLWGDMLGEAPVLHPLATTDRFLLQRGHHQTTEGEGDIFPRGSKMGTRISRGNPRVLKEDTNQPTPTSPINNTPPPKEDTPMKINTPPHPPTPQSTPKTPPRLRCITSHSKLLLLLLFSGRATRCDFHHRGKATRGDHRRDRIRLISHPCRQSKRKVEEQEQEQWDHRRSISHRRRRTRISLIQRVGIGMGAGGIRRSCRLRGEMGRLGSCQGE